MSNARDKANIPALNFSSTGIDDNATSTAITIDSSERVGLQYATPSNFNASAQDLIIGGGSGSKGFTIYSGASNNGSIYFADGVSGAEQYRGYIAYAHADNSLRIGTSSSEKMRIDSSGLVRVGNTSHTNSIIGANFDLVIGNESSGASGLAILAPSNENSYIGFFDNNNSGSFRGALHYNHTNDYLRFYTYGSERMRIHSSGNVGIGTSSPGANLHIESSSGETGTLIKTTASDTGVNLTLNGNKTSNTGGIGSIQFQNSGDSVGMIRSFREGANDAGGLSFWTQATGGSNSERMRIMSGGTVLVATTNVLSASNTTDTGVQLAPSNIWITSNGASALRLQRLTSTGLIQTFYYSGSLVGDISVTASSTSYNTSSDYRLKENVDYTFDATSRLKELKPARFNFIADANTTVDGFLAHEVSSVVPEAISGEKDETETKEKVVVNANGNVIAENIEQADWETGKITDEDGNTQYPTDSTWEATKVVPVYQGIDQSKLVPLLVKTIQELESRITALEANNP